MPDRSFAFDLLKVIGLTVACIALLYGACFLYARNNDPEYVARAAHEALVERDAEELLALATPEEVEALGLTEQNLQRFIDNYVFRGFSRVEFEGDYVHPDPDSHSAGYSLSRKYRVDGTSTMTFYFSVHGQGSIKHLISSLFEGRAALGEDPRAMEMTYRLKWADVIERDIDILNATGITAMYDGFTSLNWAVYAAQLRDWERRN